VEISVIGHGKRTVERSHLVRVVAIEGRMTLKRFNPGQGAGQLAASLQA